MIDFNPLRKLAARPRAGGLLALLVLAGLPVIVTPLRADNPPAYSFEIDSNAAPGALLPHTAAMDSSNNKM